MDDLKAELAAQEWAGGALVRESERLRELLSHAEEVNSELVTEREQLRAEVGRLLNRYNLANNYAAELEAEIERLRGLLNDSAALERRRLQEEEIERLRAALKLVASIPWPMKESDMERARRVAVDALESDKASYRDQT